MSLLDDLITVRRVLEQEMARAAAARLTEDELATLAENIERMEATTTTTTGSARSTTRSTRS